MGKLGISIFIGMEQTIEENSAYLKLARGLGYEKLFTSLHIPEADYSTFLPECKHLLEAAAKLGYEVTADVSPRFWTMLKIVPRDLRALGISSLRIDYGFDVSKILELADISKCMIELNASVAADADVKHILSAGLDRNLLRAGHNYYPRPETGLSFEGYMRQSEIFKKRGIPVSAFIPCLLRPRGPVFAGLPTLEAHRAMATESAVRQLWASGGVDTVVFGDPLVPEPLLSAVAQYPEIGSDPLCFRVKTAFLQDACKSILGAPLHTNRLDAAEYVVRSQESRALCLSPVLPRTDFRERRRGDVTIDNMNYGRYMGELQIVLHDLPADERVNIVGQIQEEDICLLECLIPGRSFFLKEV